MRRCSVTFPNAELGSQEESRRRAAEDLTKSTWMDLYADLFRQTHGEDSNAAAILEDALWRAGVIYERMVPGVQKW